MRPLEKIATPSTIVRSAMPVEGKRDKARGTPGRQLYKTLRLTTSYVSITNGKYNVTGRELVALVESEDFRTRLATAANITMRTGHESGFSVYRDLAQGVDLFTPTFEGTTDSLPREEHSDWKRRTIPQWPYDQGDWLLDLHFHPEYDEPLAVSQGDLFQLDGASPDFNFRPIVAIGTVTPDGDCCLLLLQKSSSKPIIEHAALLDECLEIIRSNDLNYGCQDSHWPQLPNYIKSEVLQARCEPRQSPANLQNSYVMNRFAYSIRHKDPEDRA